MTVVRRLDGGRRERLRLGSGVSSRSREPPRRCGERVSGRASRPARRPQSGSWPAQRPAAHVAGPTRPFRPRAHALAPPLGTTALRAGQGADGQLRRRCEPRRARRPSNRRPPRHASSPPCGDGANWSTTMDPDELFATIIDELGDDPAVVAPGDELATGFGSGTLKVNGKIFAMVASSNGRLVLKLPRARVAELVAAGTGDPFNAGKRWPLKEWVTVLDDDPTAVRRLGARGAGLRARPGGLSTFHPNRCSSRLASCPPGPRSCTPTSTRSTRRSSSCSTRRSRAPDRRRRRRRAGGLVRGQALRGQGGMSGWRAKRLCPDLMFVKGHFSEYQRLATA